MIFIAKSSATYKFITDNVTIYAKNDRDTDWLITVTKIMQFWHSGIEKLDNIWETNNTVKS